MQNFYLAGCLTCLLVACEPHALAAAPMAPATPTTPPAAETRATPAAQAQAQAGKAWQLRIVVPRANRAPEVMVWTAESMAGLATQRLRTRVPWEAGRTVHVWEGVSLKRLLQHLHADGASLRVNALNDYNAVLPWSDIDRHEPMLAWLRDGRPIAVRDMGPLIIVYPFDQDSQLLRAEISRRSVWHVNELVVEP